MKQSKVISFLAFALSILALAGVFFILNELGNIKNAVSNCELAIELSQRNTTVISEASSTESKNIQNSNKTILIPTAILFETISSPLLSPQTNITIAIEGVSKTEDGTIKIHLRAFTNDATSYSAIEPRNFFELIDLTAGGVTAKPLDSEGVFNSIPPKSAVSGNVVFKIDPTKNSIILQINHGESIKHYELDFERRSYKEPVLG